MTISSYKTLPLRDFISSFSILINNFQKSSSVNKCFSLMKSQCQPSEYSEFTAETNSFNLFTPHITQDTQGLIYKLFHADVTTQV